MKLNTKRTFQFYAKHVMRCKGFVTLMLVAITAEVALGLVAPYFYKKMVDLLVANAEVQTVIRILFMVLGVYLVQWIFSRIAQFGNDTFQPRIMATIYNECFDYLHRHAFNFFNDNFVGSLVKKVNRFTDSFGSLAGKIYWNLIPLALNALIIFAVLFYLHPAIGITLFIWTALFLVFNVLFSRYKLKYDLPRAEADSRVSGALADSVSNNINIKLFSALDFENHRFQQVTQDWFRKTRISWNIGSLAEAIQSLFAIALEIIIFYIALRLWKAGRITIGDFVWIQAYLIQLFMRIWEFGRIVREIYEHLANAEEMTVILNTPHGVSDQRGARALLVPRGQIEFKDVCFMYSQETEVIHRFNLRIKPGEKVGLIGPSGGGKTTITKILLRLYDVKNGEVLIDGQNIAHVTQESLRRGIAFVPQDPILFHRSLMENIRYGRREASDEEVTAAARLAHAHEFISKFPKGYETYVGERGVKLSGGERQRVAIARAILANAPILILDEATSALDSEAEKLIQDALNNLMKQKTAIVIAHRLSTIMRMDRIVAVQNGKIAEEGTHAELVSKTSSLYKKLWDLQVGGYVDQ